MTADAPTASVVGTLFKVAPGISEQLTVLRFSVPVLVSVAVNVTSKFWLAWLKVLTQTPGLLGDPFTTLILGLVIPVQVAFEFVVTGVLLVAPTPLQVMVSVAVAPAWL